jgi:hypothetical protein
MLSINITAPDLGPEINRLQRMPSEPRRIMNAAGKQLEGDLRDHFQARNQEPNKQGFPRKNFWAGIGRATALSSYSASEAVVTVSDPAINQKVYGGTITPKRGRALAIPLIGEAYKAGSPRALQNNFLRLLVTKAGKAFLVERETTKGKSMSFAGRFWYQLVPKVTQAPDPRALPEPSYLEGSVLAAIRGVIEPEILKDS